jgi:hypothetical protein
MFWRWRFGFASPVPLLSTVVGLVGCSGSDSAERARELTGAWVEFEDSSAGFVTSEVYDSDREIVQFDGIAHAMVDADGTSIAGWTTAGNDLDWDQNSIAFRVLFGSEGGGRRAYFT